MIGKEEGGQLVGEQIVMECRRIKGPVLIYKTAGHRAQRIVAYGLPAEAWITRKWRIVKS